MPDWSPAIANEFIRLAKADNAALTQMQLQKLVYIAHGWNLAINGSALTFDNPEAWDYGPVYKELRGALREYGRAPVKREIKNSDFAIGMFEENLEEEAKANLSEGERQVIYRVYRDYGKYHAFKLSALTHEPGTPWSKVYDDGVGKTQEIPANMIRDHFIELATKRRAGHHA
jgi:uncharacterized phage-associated protein